MPGDTMPREARATTQCAAPSARCTSALERLDRVSEAQRFYGGPVCIDCGLAAALSVLQFLGWPTRVSERV
jgi:hypothetical protein